MNRKSALSKIKDRKLRRMGEWIVEDMKRLKVPGVAIGVWHKGEETAAGFGVTSLENPLPVTENTLFQVGSISKTFTATILMILAGQGKLELDLPVRTYLPSLELADAEVSARVTTRQLLTHTGGWVGDYFNDFGNGANVQARMVKSLANLAQITPLGAYWSYNNSGFNIAGRLVEVLARKPYEEAVRKIIMRPLGMDRTTFYPDDSLLTERVAVGHIRKNGKIIVGRPWAVGRVTNPVGGVVSTVRELMRYARFHMGDGSSASGKQIISQDGLKMMQTAQVDAGGRGKIGLPWFIRELGGKRVLGHGGSTLGQQASFHFIPSEDFAIAVLANSDDGAIIANSALAWALDVYFGIQAPERTAITKSGEELGEFCGLYDLPISAFRLEAGDGWLVLKDIPRGGFPTPKSPAGDPGPDVRLAFYENDRFFGLDEPFKGGVGEFIRDEHGKVAYCRIFGRIHPLSRQPAVSPASPGGI